MNAIEMLRDDHETVKDLFDQIQQCDDRDEKRELFNMIKEELTIHAYIEETIFYPAFSEFEDFKDLLNESYREHQEVKDLLEEIEESDDDQIDDQIDELIESVEHHVEEEENEFFPKAQNALDEAKLHQLALRIDQTKQEKIAA